MANEGEPTADWKLSSHKQGLKVVATNHGFDDKQNVVMLIYYNDNTSDYHKVADVIKVGESKTSDLDPTKGFITGFSLIYVLDGHYRQWRGAAAGSGHFTTCSALWAADTAIEEVLLYGV